MSGEGRFDWATLMRIGIGQLGLTPAQFWAITPVELLLMLGQADGPKPLDRSGFDALAARFPDKWSGEEE